MVIRIDAVNAFQFASRTVFIIFLPISVTVGIISLFIKVLLRCVRILTRAKDVGLGGRAEAKTKDIEISKPYLSEKDDIEINRSYPIEKVQVRPPKVTYANVDRSGKVYRIE
jgi:hypothetical protein